MTEYIIFDNIGAVEVRQKVSKGVQMTGQNSRIFWILEIRIHFNVQHSSPCLPRTPISSSI